MFRRLILKFVIKSIHKYFSDGVSVICNSEEDIIAYKWVWSAELDNTVTKKGE